MQGMQGADASMLLPLGCEQLHGQSLKQGVTGPMQCGVTHITACPACFVTAEPLAASGSRANNWLLAMKAADEPWETETVEEGSLPGL